MGKQASQLKVPQSLTLEHGVRSLETHTLYLLEQFTDVSIH